jgi:hypothetical protein
MADSSPDKSVHFGGQFLKSAIDIPLLKRAERKVECKQKPLERQLAKALIKYLCIIMSRIANNPE